MSHFGRNEGNLSFICQINVKILELCFVDTCPALALSVSHDKILWPVIRLDCKVRTLRLFTEQNLRHILLIGFQVSDVRRDNNIIYC